jgi:glycosyltransferase involved in cell wall biosynthesis
MGYKYKLSVCVCIKNEAKYMEEFIKHYINQGVDHFYIINNNSDDNIEEIINQSIYKCSITLVNDNRNINILNSNEGPHLHKEMLNENLYEIIKKDTKWAIIVDVDEFMYGKNGHTIKTYLSTIDNNIGCIYVIWNIINPNKDSNNNLVNEFSLKNNTKRLNYDLIHQLSFFVKNANNFGKSIVRTSMLIDSKKLWLHKIQVNGTTITNYNNVIEHNYDNNNCITYSEDNFEKLNITLNHYAIRNLEDYHKKQRQLDTISVKNDFINGLFEMLELDDFYFVTDNYITKFSN